MDQIALRLFDVDLLLECNDEMLLAMFQRLYHQMAIDPAAVRPDVRRSRFVHHGSQTTLQIADQSWQLVNPHPRFAHNLIWYDAVQQMRSHLLLHAAGIMYDGAGSLLVGYSMSGKTTLSLAMMGAGAQLLTDDAVGICYATRELDALARQVQIRPKTRQLLDLPATITICPSQPYPLKYLFILGHNDPPPPHQLLLDVQIAPEVWQMQLRNLPCVKQLSISPVSEGWLRCQLHLSASAASCYPVVEQLCATHGVLIFDVQAADERTSTFGEKAEIRPITPSTAAFQLLPHLQNRSLAQQLGGEVPLYLSILNLIQATHCYQLTVGTPADTTNKLFQLFAAT